MSSDTPLDPTPEGPAEAIPFVEPVALPPAEPDEPAWVEPLPRPPHPGFWWSVLWVVVYFLAFVGLQIGVAVVVVGVQLASGVVARQDLAKLGNPKFAQSDEGARLSARLMVPTMAGAEAGIVALVLLLIVLIVGRDWTRQLALRRPGLGHLGLTVLGLPALMLASNAAHWLARQGLGNFTFHYQQMVEEMLRSWRSWPWWSGVLVIGLGPALNEELFCRGFLGRGLVGRYGRVGGVLLTSLFFGILHLDPPHVVATFVMGLGLHYVYLTTRSLWLPILLHLANNSLAVLSSWLGAAPPEGAAAVPGQVGVDVIRVLDVPSLDQAPGVYAAGLLLLAAVGAALFRSRARIVPTGEPAAYPWRPAYPGVEYPPPGSGLRVARPWPDVLALAPVVLALLAFAGAAYYYQWWDVAAQAKP